MQYLIAPYNHRIRTLVYQCCDAAALEDDETPDAGAAAADYSPAKRAFHGGDDNRTIGTEHEEDDGEEGTDEG